MAAGLYDVRAVGRFGISNPRVFAIGALPEKLAGSTNSSSETALTLAVNSTGNGRSGSEAFQFFKVEAEEDQLVLIECEAGTLDLLLNPSPTVLDAAGRAMSAGHGDAMLDVLRHAGA